MSDIALRKRSAVEIVDAAFQLYRRHALVFVMVTALAYAPWLVLQLVLGRFTTATPNAEWMGTFTGLLIIFGSMITFTLMSGVTTKIGSHAYLHGDTGRVEDAIKEVLPRVPALIGAAIGRSLLIMLGSLLLIIPGIIFFLMYVAVAPLIVLENKSVGESFVRSAQLTRNQKFHVFVTYLLVGLIYALLFAGVMVLMVMALSTGPGILPPVVLTIFIIVLYPLFGLVEMLIYYDLRVRNEGYDVEIMAGSLGERPTVG